MASKRFYVTTPIYYVNDRPHLGTAYTTIAADVLARYHRSAGFDTLFLTGLDEHGQKIARAAEQMDMPPELFVDRMAQPFIDIWKALDISYDDFIRTTEGRHKLAVQKLWRNIYAKGDIYLGRYEGLYCFGCEAYYTEKDLNEDGSCPMGHGKISEVSMPSYFFRLSKYANTLLEFYEAHPDFVKPQVRFNEVKSFVREGLKDISISRTNFKWGIGVPGDPDHVIYVWFDALTNYISAIGWGKSSEIFEKYWPADYHLIGKDILRFHAVYWPAMLIAGGIQPPKTVYAHGWLTVERQKMSKSARNALDPLKLKWEYGSDALRYYLLRENVFGFDGDFSHETLIGRINSDLANDLGNLLNRTVTLARKFTGGVVPSDKGTETSEEGRLRTSAIETAKAAGDFYHEANFSKALEVIWKLCAELNRYVDVTQPWKVAQQRSEERVGKIIYHCLEGCRFLALMIAPVMPLKSRQMLRQLGLEPPSMDREMTWPDRWGELKANQSLPEPHPLFPRINEKVSSLIKEKIGFDSFRRLNSESKQTQKEHAGDPQFEGKGKSEEQHINLQQFKKIDMRTGKILACEIPRKSKKLLKLKIDIGKGCERVIMAGLAEQYSPEELIGKSVIVVANLKPTRLMGITSEGMVLAAEDDEGRIILVVPEKEIAPGSKVL